MACGAGLRRPVDDNQPLYLWTKEHVLNYVAVSALGWNFCVFCVTRVGIHSPGSRLSVFEDGLRGAVVCYRCFTTGPRRRVRVRVRAAPTPALEK